MWREMLEIMSLTFMIGNVKNKLDYRKMKFDLYMKEFQLAATSIDKQRLDKAGIHLFTGIVMESVAIKAYKPEWSNDPENAVNATSRIFFSAWVNEKALEENKLYYN